MPRLTRTQKFAELRDSLANDREPSLSTKDLSDYENRLSNISDQLSNSETTDKAPQTIKEETDPKYVWTSFKEPQSNPVDELVDTIRTQEFENRITQPSAFNNIQEFPQQGINPLVEEFKPGEDLSSSSSAAEPMIKTKPVPDIDFLIDDILNNSSDNTAAQTNSNVSYTQQNQSAAVQSNQVDSFEPIEAPYAETEEIVDDSEERELVEEVSDNHAADHDEIFNEFFSDTFSEVSQYNKENGEKTITDLTGNMVDEIRHHVEPEFARPAVQQTVVEEAVIEEPVFEETAAEQPQTVETVEEEPVIENYYNDVSDDEFSNTVSMEITKIMDEISSIDTAKKEEPAYVYNEPAPAAVERPRPARRAEKTEEHPVLAKRQEEVKEEEEEVVEIKNLKELEAEPAMKQTGTISNTIPFVVATEEEDVIDDDDEDEGSNTILNIILVVLIIVLVAVLGLIIFYILKTKGII